MQQGLPLTFPAENISALAIHLKLTDVPLDGLPAFDLSRIFVRKPPTEIIAAVPLKPAAWIIRVYPALPAPHRERLAGGYTKKIHACVGFFRGELGSCEPAMRKLILAVGHVLSTEHAKAQHFRWRKVRPEAWIEVAPNRRDENVPVTPLHPVVHSDGSLLHRDGILFQNRFVTGWPTKPTGNAHRKRLSATRAPTQPEFMSSHPSQLHRCSIERFAVLVVRFREVAWFHSRACIRPASRRLC